MIILGYGHRQLLSVNFNLSLEQMKKLRISPIRHSQTHMSNEMFFGVGLEEMKIPSGLVVGNPP